MKRFGSVRGRLACQNGHNARGAVTAEGTTGIVRERKAGTFDLPVSTYTQWYWKIDLHNLLHFLSLRVDPRAQWEIQQFARVIAGKTEQLLMLGERPEDTRVIWHETR